ncbi:hypothetical protein MACK_002644 [Theileria orientalis]|uniref:DNA recombination and repair protein Rad51-like C-terminal domain-containing protein n=1 Tax=Theileria orientalis TaxID=68886 RepID=A0A976MDA7_THEOR|nr:hypothetical protein MACK_002644 [Theileria orientalis]
MNDTPLSPECDDDLISSTILKTLEECSKLSISNLNAKRLTPTRSQSINTVLNGGIHTQEITEFFGDDFEASGELLTHLIFENLEEDPLAEAIIITTNYSQNENRLLDVCREFYKRTKNSTRLDHYIANTLNRIYIVPCLSSNDLYHIISLIYGKKYKHDSIYHLSIVTIHIFSSLFDESNPSYVKKHSRFLSFALRDLAIHMNCAIFVSNFQTQLSISNESVFDPFLETDNAVFSKLSELWHSIVNTRIHLQSYSMGNLLMIRAKVVKGEMSGYPETTISLIKAPAIV